MDELEQAADRILIDGLPPSIKRLIDGALEAGAAPDRIRRSLSRSRPQGLIALAIDAYLEQIAARPRS